MAGLRPLHYTYYKPALYLTMHILTRRLPSSSGSTRYQLASTPATTPSLRCGRRPRTRALAALHTLWVSCCPPRCLTLLPHWQENLRARGFGPQPPQLAAQAPPPPRLAAPQHPAAPGGAPGAPAVPAPAGAMGGGMGRAARPLDGAGMGMLLALASPIAPTLTPTRTPYTPAPPLPPPRFLPLPLPLPP